MRSNWGLKDETVVVLRGVPRVNSAHGRGLRRGLRRGLLLLLLLFAATATNATAMYALC